MSVDDGLVSADSFTSVNVQQVHVGWSAIAGMQGSAMLVA